MMNFLSNSLKFTPQGGQVTVKISIIDSQQVTGDEDHIGEALVKSMGEKDIQEIDLGNLIKNLNKS